MPTKRPVRDASRVQPRTCRERSPSRRVGGASRFSQIEPTNGGDCRKHIGWSPHPELNRGPRPYQGFRSQRCGTHLGTPSETRQVMVWCVFASDYSPARTSPRRVQSTRTSRESPKRSPTEPDSRRVGAIQLRPAGFLGLARRNRAERKLVVEPDLASRERADADPANKPVLGRGHSAAPSGPA